MALPTIGNVTGTGITASTQLLNATDVAGTVAATFSATGAATIRINFGFSYDTPPIIILSSANTVGAIDYNTIYATSSKTDFTLNFNSVANVNNHLYNYHIFETQTSNASSTWNWTGVGAVGAANCTDVAGLLTIKPSAVTGSVAATMSFGYAYGTAPIVVYSAADAVFAGNANKWNINSVSTTSFNFVSSITTQDTQKLMYHIIETQASNASSPFGVITLLNATTASLSSGSGCTDVAGSVSITWSTSASQQTATFTFGYSYSVAPIVVISPTSGKTTGEGVQASKTMTFVFVQSTTSGFSILLRNGSGQSGTASYNYHIIETQ